MDQLLIHYINIISSPFLGIIFQNKKLGGKAKRKHTHTQKKAPTTVGKRQGLQGRKDVQC